MRRALPFTTRKGTCILRKYHAYGPDVRISHVPTPSNFAQKRCSMNFAMTFKNVEVREPVELEANRQLGKLEKLLKSYAPDAVQLHATFEKQARKPEYFTCLNLSMPTGTLHCTGSGNDIPRSLKAAFSELSSQLKRHQSRLRHDSEWKRKRPRAAALAH